MIRPKNRKRDVQTIGVKRMLRDRCNFYGWYKFWSPPKICFTSRWLS